MSLFPISRAVSSWAVVLLFATGLLRAEPVSNEFTYQGQLLQTGSPVSGSFDLQFQIWDALAAGNSFGDPVVVEDVAVADGLFAVSVPLGDVIQMNGGQAMWMEIGLRPGADAGAFTLLAPRQPLTPAPVAFTIAPGSKMEASGPNGGSLFEIIDSGFGSRAVRVTANGGLGTAINAIAGEDSIYGIRATSSATFINGAAISGQSLHTNAIAGSSSGPNRSGVEGKHSTYSGYGVYGENSASTGTAIGVYGRSNSIDGIAVSGNASSTATGASGIGVYGVARGDNGIGVSGEAHTFSNSGIGVQGLSNAPDGIGVRGRADRFSGTGIGVHASTKVEDGYGLYAENESNSGESIAIYGRTNSNVGIAILGEIASSSSPSHAIKGVNPSTHGLASAVWGESTGTIGNPVGVRGTSNSHVGRGVLGHNTAVSGVAYGVYAQSDSPEGTAIYGSIPSTTGVNNAILGRTLSSEGRGVMGDGNSLTGVNYGVYGQTFSPDGFAGYFRNFANDGTALYAQSAGQTRNKPTLRVNNTAATSGVAAYVTSGSNFSTAHFANSGSGQVLWLQNGGTDADGAGGGDFISARNNAEDDSQFRVLTTGEVRSDVGFNTPAADFAEMLPAANDGAGLEPGDVLAIGPGAQLIRSTIAYQTSVAGVYSTKPGFVGGMPMEGAAIGTVPLAIMGIVPVKVSAENGAIAPGDLLAASATPGHAMKAGPNAPQGSIIGKAMGELPDGTGVIQALITLQ